MSDTTDGAHPPAGTVPVPARRNRLLGVSQLAGAGLALLIGLVATLGWGLSGHRRSLPAAGSTPTVAAGPTSGSTADAPSASPAAPAATPTAGGAGRLPALDRTGRPPAPAVAGNAAAGTSAPGPAPVIRYADFTDTTGLVLNGSARRYGPALRLAGAELSVSGSAWSLSTLDSRRSFSARFRLALRGPADGLAFVVQREGPAALGADAQSLGYDDYRGGDRRIRPSVAVEFDVYRNSFEPYGNHVGITVGGDARTHQAIARPAFTMASGVPFTAWVDYDAARRVLAVWVGQDQARPAAPLVSAHVDLAAMFASGRGWAGFTGSTGGFSGTHDVLSWQLAAA